MRDVLLFLKYAVCTVFFVCLHVAVWGAPFTETTAASYRRNSTARLTARRTQQLSNRPFGTNPIPPLSLPRLPIPLHRRPLTR